MSQSRTKLGLINSSISSIYMVVQLLLDFYSRKIFINYLGDEILGLNTTAVNILQFINLAELGIGTAVGFSLYRPIRQKNHDTICEIIALQGFLYRRIAIFMIIGALAVMAFFPIIFKKISLPLWYAYASFGVMLFSSLLSYFFTYRQVLLSSSQKDYAIQLSYRTWIIIKIVFQMLAVAKLPNPYVWWLILEVIFAIIATISLHRHIKHTFPYLRPVTQSFHQLKKTHAIIFTKIKQLIFHRIAGFALFQASPLIIYAYLSLSVVTIYGNYLIIVNGIRSACDAVFGSTAAGVGDLIAENNTSKILTVFEEIFSIRFFFATIASVCFTILTPPFIQLWIGRSYILPAITVIIIAGVLFINIYRYALDIFINAFGLFKDIWSPIAEALINITISIAFGYLWGLPGILSGSLISLIIIIGIWKPYFLYTCGLKQPPLKYLTLFLRYTLLATAAILITTTLYRFIPIDPAASWTRFLIASTLFVILLSAILSTTLYFTTKGFRLFINRLINLTK